MLVLCKAYDYESFSLTDEYLLRGLVSIILDSGMAI